MDTLFTTSLAMSAVILLVLLVHTLSSGKLSAQFRYYMWIVVLFGLLIPFRPSIPAPQIQIPISFETPSPETTPIVLPSAESVPIKSAPIPYDRILLGAWIIGTLCILAFHLWMYVKFTTSVRRWGIEVDMLPLIDEVKADLGLMRKRVIIKTCAFVSSPMLVGFLNPTILLPERQVSLDEMDYILRHELTHYRRGDLWINLLVLLVTAIHWFNPFVHIMSKCIRADCEAACDEEVIYDNTPDERRHYGETIIGFIGAKNSNAPVLSTYFFGGSGSMKRRLFSIMDTSKKSKTLAVVCAIVVIAAIIGSSSLFSVSGAQTNRLSVEQAKAIALGHAGVSESQVSFIKAYLEYENGRPVYDIEFYSEFTEYDYEIDAVSGIILKYDRDIEGFQLPSNTPGVIGEAAARAIALEHAGLTDATFIRVRLERESGRLVYDVEFFSGNIEYDYEIDALTGEILGFDLDIENFLISAAAPELTPTPEPTSPLLTVQPEPTPEPTPQPASTPASTPAPTPQPTPVPTPAPVLQPVNTPASQHISAERAKEIALNHAGLTAADVIFVGVSLERDDGRMVYDIEFYSGNVEYDYEIDAVTGMILEHDRDIEHFAIPRSRTTNQSAEQFIGEDRAISIALSAAGLTQSQVRGLKVKLERENGIMVYEVEFDHGRTEYEYEIDAISGAILKIDIDHD